MANSLRNGLIFASGAILLAAPWYVKNLVWTGDPLFPLLLPTPLVEPRQIELWVAYMQSFGYHNTWLDYLTLPFRWVFNHRAFGTYLGEVDLPHPLYLLFPLMLWTRRKENAEKRKTLDLLALLILSMFIAWALQLTANPLPDSCLSTLQSGSRADCDPIKPNNILRTDN